MHNNDKIIELIKKSEGWKKFAKDYSKYAEAKNWEDEVQFEFYEDELNYSVSVKLTAIDYSRINFGTASYDVMLGNVCNNLSLQSTSQVLINDNEMSLPIVSKKNVTLETVPNKGKLLDGTIIHKIKSTYQYQKRA